MLYRSLGRCGLKVPALSLGTWITFGEQIGDEVAYELVARAMGAGIIAFDTAEGYARGRAEIVLGEALRRGGWRRNELVISTKLFFGGGGPNDRGLSRKHVIEGLAASLDRLGMEYVDIVYCHRADSDTPVEETVRAMNHVLARGWALYWGTSEWDASRVAEAIEVARRDHLAAPVVEQPQYHVRHRRRVEQEYARLSRDYGMGFAAWGALGGGLLSGKHDTAMAGGSRFTMQGYEWLRERFDSEEGQRWVATGRAIAPIAADLSCTAAQLAIAWCLARPAVSTVILGASSVEQLDENLGALDVLESLDAAVLARIDAILAPEPEAA